MNERRLIIWAIVLAAAAARLCRGAESARLTLPDKALLNTPTAAQQSLRKVFGVPLSKRMVLWSRPPSAPAGSESRIDCHEGHECYLTLEKGNVLVVRYGNETKTLVGVVEEK